jgi:hypothetical protein
MKRFASRVAWSASFALGIVGCGANVTPLVDDPYTLTPLSDFENSTRFNPNPLWVGNFIGSHDNSRVDAGYSMTFETPELSPARTNPDGSVSAHALHVADEGAYTEWGTAVVGDLRPGNAVDLSQFVGFAIWARSAGAAGTPVRVQFADYGSFDQVKDAPQLCDPVDASSPNSCYDDYTMKIYPDGAWRRWDVPFSSLATGGWGYRHDFDPRRVYRIKLSMLPSTKYDLWFDDAAFLTPRAPN